MSQYKITTDLFTLPYKNEESVLYAPLVGFVCKANDDLINFLANLEDMENEAITPELKQIIEFLIKKGIINGSQSELPDTTRNKELSPSQLCLFPTNQCNMNCIYCYAAANRIAAKTMDWEIATSAVEYYINLMKKEGRKFFGLEFHGGGEPFFAWNLVHNIVNYIDERCSQEHFETKICSATNGVLNDKQLEWIVKHMSFLCISFEGLPHVQDYHRKMADGTGSFEYVDHTIRYLDEHRFSYMLRCTVSKHNEDLLDETIDFILQNYKTKLLCLEPVYICGGCYSDDLKTDFSKFAENYKRLEPVCAAKGLRLEHSGAQFERIVSSFCHVGNDDFAVTPDGYLTKCWEVTSKDYPLANTFIFGQMLPEGKISLNHKKLDFLRSLAIDKLSYCKDCFAKWHCAGGCVTKLGHDRYDGSRGGDACKATRELIAHRIIQLLEVENQTLKTGGKNE